MKLEWTTPVFKYRLNPPAIYKLEFDNGYYYIGSSMHVKTRIGNWKTNLKNDRFPSKMIRHSVNGATSVIASILEFCTVLNERELKQKETEYLMTFFKDPLFMNTSPSGLDNTGVSFKVLPEQLIKPIKAKKRQEYKPKGRFKPSPDHVWAFSKGIIQFDLNGNYIKSHKSIQDAANEVGVKRKFIYQNMQVKRHRYGVKGFVFKVCGDNSPIELLVRKTPIIRENAGKIKRKVVVDTNTGEKVTVEIAAQRLGLTKKYFYKVITESDGKVNNTPFRYNGEYIWEYA